MTAFVTLLLCLILLPMSSQAGNLTDDQVAAFARLALRGIEKEYPNKPSQVMVGVESLLTPRQMHPVFYGCFDWHSAVHGHWMLTRLLKSYPNSPIAKEMRDLLDRQLTAEKLAQEAAYFDRDENRGFERTYGWAWTLRLAMELRTWQDPQGQQLAAHLRPLEDKLVSLTQGYLPLLTYPIRTGVHQDTAFALGQFLDYARAVDNVEFEKTIVKYTREKYLADRDYPASFEPSGEDFFSPALNEADLMRRVLSPAEFAFWLAEFLPDLDEPRGKSSGLLRPVVVSDVTDPKIVHLAGLNLSRAWCLQGIIAGLPAEDSRRPALAVALAGHQAAGLGYVFSGHYEGEHWLATFGVYLLDEVGINSP